MFVREYAKNNMTLEIKVEVDLQNFCLLVDHKLMIRIIKNDTVICFQYFLDTDINWPICDGLFCLISINYHRIAAEAHV